MLIEELIRLGRPLLEGDMDPEEVLALITDASDVRVKNFYRHVFIVELPAADKGKPRALRMQEFGQEDDGGDFEVNQPQAAAAPFVLPSGGNPLNPQGRYGLPVYPCYDRHVRAFRESPEEVVAFLQARLERTPAFAVSEEMVGQIAGALHEAVAKTDFGNERKILGVLVLARCEPGGFYALSEPGRTDRIGDTEDGKDIVPNYSRIIEGVWAAKIGEGREAGTRAGACTFTGVEGEVVSAYCKAWPWAFPTWTCPLPHGGDEAMLVEEIGLSADTYRALTLGACVFNRLTRPVRREVIPEVFSPADNRAGKEQRKAGDLPTIQGSAFLLPVLDRSLETIDQRSDFVQGVRAMLAADPNDPTLADRYMTAVVGFDAFLPPNMAKDDYRLTLVYFSGDYTRGDVKLRAFIQDVIPSTLGALRELALAQATSSMTLLRTLMPWMSEKRQAYLGRCYQSVPYLLARAYGGAYLWQQLESVLHRRPLDSTRVIANAARRMQSLVPHWPKSASSIFDEVGFYLSFLKFLTQANAHPRLANQKGDNAMPMRPWNELIQALERAPLEAMKFDSVAELGFACGLLVRWFSGWYSHELGKDKDFLKDRVLTFGANLSPRDVGRAVRLIRDVSHKFDNLRRNVELGQLAYYQTKQERSEHVGDYARRLGIVLAELERQSTNVEKCRDEFMTGFWSGYSLQGYDRPRTPKKTGKEPVTQSSLE